MLIHTISIVCYLFSKIRMYTFSSQLSWLCIGHKLWQWLCHYWLNWCHVASSGAKATDHLSPSSSVLCCHLHLSPAVLSPLSTFLFPALFFRYFLVALFLCSLEVSIVVPACGNAVVIFILTCVSKSVPFSSSVLFALAQTLHRFSFVVLAILTKSRVALLL